MPKLTHDIVIEAYKKDNPLDILMLAFFGLFEWYLPARVLVGSVFALFSGGGNVWVLSGVLLLLIPFWCLILARGTLATLLRERRSIRRQTYRLVRTVCVQHTHIEASGDAPPQDAWRFQADDDAITISDMRSCYGISEGDSAYLLMVQKHPVIVFPATQFYADPYETTLKPHISTRSESEG